MSCPGCDRSAPYHNDLPRTPLSLFGPIRFHRAYYYCRRCGRGQFPFDQQAGISPHNVTPAVEQLSVLAGAVGDSFERGADLLKEMASVSLAESTVQRCTEDAGRRIEEHLQQGDLFGPPTQWDWYCDAQGRRVAYCTIDATGIRQQGPQGSKAEGRMAYVAGVYNPLPAPWLPQPAKPPRQMQARYVSGLYALEQMGTLLRNAGADVGMEQADLWICLSDGGNGLEGFAQRNFNRGDLVVILDFYHPAGYLEDLAKKLHAGDEAEATRQAEEWCRLLKEEGGAVMLEVLRQWSWPQRQSKALREQRDKTEEYFGNNVHRMEYPEYLAEGWQIGSGVVESACKTVVGQRLKGAGKRWGEAGSHAVCHVRALYRSEKELWKSFWKRQFFKRTNVQQNN